MPNHRTPRIVALALALLSSTAVCAAVPTAAQGDTGLTQQELDIWNDPGFRQRFVESYIARSDVEPKPASQEEVDAINRTLELMRADDLEGALEAAVAARDNPEADMSALMDFLAANIQLNIAMNLKGPDEDASEQQRERYTIARNKYLADAAAGYRSATAKHAKYLRAWSNLAIVYLRLEDYKGARDAFVKVIALGGAGADTYGLLGFCHTALGDHLPAESAYRMANLMQPEKEEWERRLVQSFLMQKRYHEVVAMTGTMIEDDPENADLWLMQANAYIGMEQPGKAAENYEILDGLGKSTAQTMNMLANIYTNQGLYDVAVDRYAKALELADEDGRRAMLPQLLTSARVLSSHGESSRPATRALIRQINESFKEVLSEKDQTMLLRLQARIALAEGADDEQAKILEEVVNIDPIDGEALLLLGQHYARLQEWDRAINFYERAANIEGYEADAKVYHADALVKSDRAAQAVPLLRQAQEIKPRESVQQYLEAVERMK